jgi:hypothetical protein
MEDSKLWKCVLKMYEEVLGIPPEITELLSVIDILDKCVQGLSNTTIARYTDTSPEYISRTLEKYLGFQGFLPDLDFSAIGVYNRVSNKEEFLLEAEMVSPFTSDIETIYEACKKYSELEERLKIYGY